STVLPRVETKIAKAGTILGRYLWQSQLSLQRIVAVSRTASGGIARLYVYAGSGYWQSKNTGTTTLRKSSQRRRSRRKTQTIGRVINRRRKSVSTHLVEARAKGFQLPGNSKRSKQTSNPC